MRGIIFFQRLVFLLPLLVLAWPDLGAAADGPVLVVGGIHALADRSGRGGKGSMFTGDPAASVSGNGLREGLAGGGQDALDGINLASSLEENLEPNLSPELEPDLDDLSSAGATPRTVYLRQGPEKQIFALLSKCSYSKKTCYLPSRGWRRLSDQEKRALGLAPELFNSPTGFHAELFRTPSGKYIIGFEGTDSVRDWGTNISQGMPVPILASLGVQYWQAARLADKAKIKLGDKLVAFTGHSLGGGQSSLAAIVTGVRAITFNAAGLNRITVGLQELHALAGRDKASVKIKSIIKNWRHRDRLITAYQVKGDELTFLQEKLRYIPTSLTIGLDVIIPDAVGHRVLLDNPGGIDLRTEHGIDAVLSADIR